MQTAKFVVQIQKLRHIVGILCKTHPDILFCLFGHSQNWDCAVAKYCSAHTAAETDMAEKA